MIELDCWFRLFTGSFKANDVKPSSLNEASIREWSRLMKVKIPPNKNTYVLIKKIFELSPAARVAMASKLTSKVAISPPALVIEIDSIITRATSFSGMAEDPAIEAKMIQELTDMTISGRWTPPPRPAPLPEELTLAVDRNLVIKVYDPTGQVVYSLSNATLMTAFHRAYPAMSLTSAGVLTIMYHFQRAYDGSNWSPDDSYKDLQRDYDSGVVGILECFSGALNNQAIIRGRPMTHGRLSLEWETLRELTGDPQFVGSWPEGVYPQLTDLFSRFPAVRLLVNPPYSEPEIARTAAELTRIFALYPRSSGKKLRVSMTLPSWSDIYDKGGPFHKIEGATIIRRAGGQGPGASIVHNKSINPEGFKVPLRYELLELYQA